MRGKPLPHHSCFIHDCCHSLFCDLSVSLAMSPLTSSSALEKSRYHAPRYSKNCCHAGSKQLGA